LGQRDTDDTKAQSLLYEFLCLDLIERKSVPQYFKTPTLQVDCADEIKYEIVDKLVVQLKNDFGKENVLDIKNIFVHLYGKEITKPFRKMGHVTILGDNTEVCLEKAEKVKKLLTVTA
jgi:hypothetical protein